jgi:hypothetical protein
MEEALRTNQSSQKSMYRAPRGLRDRRESTRKAIAKEKVAEIAADFMTTFDHEQVGALETQEFRTTPVLAWLLFRTRLKVKSRMCSLSFCYRMGPSLCQR